ncbi:MAG: DNA mismatch repair endonuclease MutL [Anaerolineae bacterium]|nr:DNA mismatch repair endonuclease MutL [Anaerolineae bacterium]
MRNDTSIRVLPPDVAAQIAAGEVVERPASVVKELVENSIDAGATDVRVDVEKGGRQSIRITDDGRGIPAAEVEIAFQRHSTSKLARAEDLDHIVTLGFRGEALASIAAVSRVTLVTRAEGEEIGTLMRLESGAVVDQRPIGRPPGTAITVQDLFYNVPARRKFLRTEATERRHIDAWVTRYAIAYPHLRLLLSHDGRETFRTPGNDDLREVLIAAYGMEVGANLVEILEDPGSGSPIRVRGFASPPSLHRANRGGITLFLNGRWIQDSRLTYAVIQAYHTLLPSGRYPVAVVMIAMPPDQVDVNVHPAKAEVRFSDGDAVFRAVQRAVRNSVTGQAPIAPTAFLRPAASGGRPWEGRSPVWAARASDAGESPLGQQPLLPQHAPAAIPALRVIGQVGAAFVVAEGPEGLYLIDQHAAHERVLYERMMAEREQGLPSQGLLTPLTVDLSPEAAGLLEAHLDSLHRLGFVLEPFGGSTVLVRALPAVLTRARPAEVLPDVVEALEEGRSMVDAEVEQAVMRRVCKRAAVKAGQVLTREEMAGLIQALEACASPRTCPHGRPTMIHISVDQLAREFGRE